LVGFDANVFINYIRVGEKTLKDVEDFMDKLNL
jgi:hypothetical protein